MKKILKKWNEKGDASIISEKMINKFLEKEGVTVDGKNYKGEAKQLRDKILREGEGSYNNYTTQKETVDAVNKAIKELNNGEEYDKIVILLHGQKESGISLFADQTIMFKEEPIIAEWRKNKKIKVVSCYQNSAKTEVRENLTAFKVETNFVKLCYYKFIPTKSETENVK